MKIFLCIFLQSILFLAANAQTEVHTTSVVNQKDLHDTAFTHVDVESTFPGGVPGWSRFLNDNLVYPKKRSKKTFRAQ